MCWGQFARQAFARLTADEHTQIVSVTEIKWLKFSGVAEILVKNDGFVHISDRSRGYRVSPDGAIARRRKHLSCRRQKELGGRRLEFSLACLFVDTEDSELD